MMGKWTKTAGLLFLAAASVYSSQAIVAAVGGRANQSGNPPQRVVAVAPQKASAAELKFLGAPEANTTDVKVLEESGSDPFSSSNPTTNPSGKSDKSDAATTQPTEGRSVSSSEVSVNDAGTVEIHVNDANLVEVLRMLSLQSQKNIVASKDVHGTVTANLYDVTVREALDAILHANGYAYREKGNFIYVYTAKEIADIEKSERQMHTEVFRTYYITAANAAVMIKPVLSTAGGQVAVSTPSKIGIASAPAGGGGDEHTGNDILVVTDYPENMDAVRKILADIDRRPQQILLEATILRATLNEDNALGVDFNIMGGVDMAGLVNGGPQVTNSGVVDPVNGGVLGANGVLPQGRTHSVGTGNAFTSPINGGLKVGYVTDSVSVFLSALEQVTDTTILANPKVLALNKEQGEVFVGNEDGYYTTLTTETTTSQSVESLKTGTRLIFRPYIANDGFVRLEVHPEDSDGQVKANGLPSKSTTEVTSNVMVKDGHTIVIGGLFRESTISGRSQVPFLGNIPLAGLLFKSQRDRTVREEVIILLTPHVIKDDVMYSKLSEEQLKHSEDLRVGVRKGLMPWGRERMAEGEYETAKKEMAKAHPDRHLAKWHLDSATNLNPDFSEAIELKEAITGYEVTTADGSSIRGFVRRVMMSDMPPTTMPSTTQPTAGATTQPSEATAETSTTQPSEETAQTDGAMTGTAEASTNDESAAIPATQPAPTTNPSADPANTTDSDPLSSQSQSYRSSGTSTETPATEPAQSTDGNVTVTPIEENK